MKELNIKNYIAETPDGDGLDSIAIYMDEKFEVDIADLYITCSPDYFAGHAINISISKAKEIKYRGLIG